MTGTLAARGPTGGGGLPLVPAPPTDRVTHPPAASVAAPPLVDPASVIAPTLGPTELEAAQASLSRGEGPAGGAPFACAPSTTVPSMTDCGRSAPSSPPAVHPASAFNPTNGLGWAIQGVPQSRGYINYALTWDPIDGYVLLFGGSNATGDYMGDTWSFQNGAWTELFPLTTPLGRDSSGLVYDPSDSSMMLFGGYTPAASAALNDTWLFRGGTWTEVPTGTGPSPRYGFGLVWDPATYTDILFGGYSPLCPTATANLCNDTWSWSDGTWTELHPTGAPPARYELSMTYDGTDGYLLMFGGYGGSTCLQPGGYCQDTWSFAAGSWTQVATGGTLCGNNATGNCTPLVAPGPRSEAALGFDSADGYAVLFGGQNQSVGSMSDTWRYVGGTWTQLAPTHTPYGRYGAGLTFDASPSDQFLFLFGGGYPQNTPPNIFWGFGGGNWTEVAPPTHQPPPTYGSSMAFDAVDGYVVFFSGYAGSLGYLNQTWTYRSGVWTPLYESTAPSPRIWASMAWDPVSSALLLFGGNSYGTLKNDTWQFEGGHWTEVCAGDTTPCAFGVFPPTPREGAGLAYEHNSQGMILFGGTAGGSVYRNDTWAWFDGYWGNYTTFERGFPHQPSPRAYAGFVDDVRDGEDVLFAGSNGTGALDDTWVLTDLYSGWKQVGSCGGPGQPACSGSTPSARSSFSMVYDSIDQVVLVTGGTNGAYGGNLEGGTYGFQGGNWSQCQSYTCNYYFGLAPLPLFPNSAYDPLDGYTILRGGLIANGLSSYFDMYEWLFGPFLTSFGPTASPQTIDLGQSVTFNAGASGGGTGTYSFEWNGLPEGCAPPSAQATTFSCVVDRPGFTFYGSSVVGYDFYAAPSLIVIDSNGFPEITSGQLTWLEVARDTLATFNGSTATAEVGQTVSYTLTATNGWGPYEFALQGAPPGCSIAGSTLYQQRYSCLLTSADLGVWSVSGSVTDSASYQALSAPDTLTVDPAASSSGITVNAVALDTGQSFSAAVTPSGGVGPYSFVWTGVPSACLADAALVSCVVPGTEAGTYDPSVVVRDADGGTASVTYLGSVVVSSPPTAEVTATPSILDTGQTLTLSVALAGGAPGADTYVWSGLPTGCATTDTSSVTCHPSSQGPALVSVVVTDANGGTASSTASLTVNGALVAGLSDQVVASTSPGVVTFFASASGGTPPLSYSWSLNGVVQTAAVGSIFSPSGWGAGTYSVTVTVSDAAGASVSPSTLSVTISGASSSGSAFGSPVQLVELALLLVLLVLAVVALLGGRRTPPAAATPPPTTASAAPPPPAGAGPDAGRPPYSEG
ncbi:MAG: kelch repeat-containing protein [Thermoplasmata archaeon]